MHEHVYVRCMCIGNTVCTYMSMLDVCMCIGNTVCMYMSMLNVLACVITVSE